MDAKLHNAYVEVLLDNFLSVVKQNVMFQTQLQVLNTSAKENADTKNQLDDVSKRNVELQSLINSLSKNNDNLKIIADKKDQENSFIENLKKEKNRIQSALNDSLKELKILKEEFQIVKDESEKRNKYIVSLESSIPQNRLKKIKSVDTTQFQTSEENNDFKSGGTF